jgi:hypothetical protein
LLTFEKATNNSSCVKIIIKNITQSNNTFLCILTYVGFKEKNHCSRITKQLFFRGELKSIQLRGFLQIHPLPIKLTATL